MRVGFIGLGNMGGPMALNMIKAGHSLVVNDIRRTMAFGQGPHFCIGVHLARLEGRLLLEQWLRRIPRYEIIEDRAVRPPSSFQWGWTQVPVRVDPGWRPS